MIYPGERIECPSVCDKDSAETNSNTRYANLNRTELYDWKGGDGSREGRPRMRIVEGKEE